MSGSSGGGGGGRVKLGNCLSSSPPTPFPKTNIYFLYYSYYYHYY